MWASGFRRLSQLSNQELEGELAQQRNIWRHRANQTRRFPEGALNIQRDVLIKPLRLMSWVRAEPSALEKDGLSLEVVVLAYGDRHPQVPSEKSSITRDCCAFKDSRYTTAFTKYVGLRKDLHDISGWKSWERPFVKAEYNGMAWLEVDFIG